MRRAIIVLAAAVLASLAVAAPASATQVTQFKFSGTFANAFWQTRSATSVTNTTVNVAASRQGPELFVDQLTFDLDANGDITGATDTQADVTSAFSFGLRQPLASASLSGSGLPAKTCTFDANFGLISCSDTTIDATATWTGQGPISREVTNQRFKSGGFGETLHFNGTSRAATATGTIGGLTLTASDPQFTSLSTTKSGLIAICIGTSC